MVFSDGQPVLLASLLGESHITSCELGLVRIATVTVLGPAMAAVESIFCDFEDTFRSWDLNLKVWVIDLVSVESLHFRLRDEAALEAEPLLSEVLAAVVADFLFGDAFSFLKPVVEYFLLDGLSRIDLLS